MTIVTYATRHADTPYRLRDNWNVSLVTMPQLVPSEVLTEVMKLHGDSQLGLF